MKNEKRLIDAYEFYKKFANDIPTINVGEQRYVATWRISDMIADAPTVDAVEVVHGEWIRCLDVDDVEYIECPICGGEFYDVDNDTFDKPYNYCPNCGAKMDGDGNE